MEREKLYTDVSGALLRKVSPVESCWSVQGKGTSSGPTRPNIDVAYSGGPTHSSVEALVMRVE